MNIDLTFQREIVDVGNDGDKDMKVVHCRKEPFDVYIGRPSKWGNPFSHKDGTIAEWKVATREDAVQMYEAYLRSMPDLLEELKELKGKTLGCWCAPKSCHGDIIIKLVEEFHGDHVPEG